MLASKQSEGAIRTFARGEPRSTHASSFDELRSGGLDLRIAPVRKAQHEPAAVAPANAEARQRYEALPVESRRQCDIVEASLTEQREVQPVLRGSKPKSKTQRRAKSVDQDRTAAIVHCIHAPDMSRIVTLLDKIRERRLNVNAAAESGDGPRRAKGTNEMRRSYDVSQPHHWRQRLTKASDVNHALVAIEALQRRKRPRQRRELAVVVVLDDVRCRFSAGPLQQGGAPRDR